VSDTADLLARLDAAVRQAVAAGEIGTAKSIRLHVGASRPPPVEPLLALGDAIFGCSPGRLERMSNDKSASWLCVWEQGQIATVTIAPCHPPFVLLTVLGANGALHFQQRAGG